MTKIALIFGITGQDGAYLTNFLLKKGYIVHGLRRRSSTSNTERIDYFKGEKFKERFFLHHGDLTDSLSITRIISNIEPDEIYNLAAMSHVHISFESPEYTANVDGLGTLRILEAVRILGLERKTRIYQASTSELYGLVQETPQRETTPFYPRSPYGVAKIYGYWITVNYREAYNLYACNGILFNHESPLRGENFVSRKITKAVTEIALGLREKMFLGNLNAKRDWGHARDYVEAMWLILQQDKPQDYVIATGITTEVRDFVKLAFGQLGIILEFKGEGVNETAYVAACQNEKYKLPIGKEVLCVDPKLYRPTEVDLLLGDCTKAKEQLGWVPKTDLGQLVKEMVDYDLALARRTRLNESKGFVNNPSIFD